MSLWDACVRYLRCDWLSNDIRKVQEGREGVGAGNKCMIGYPECEWVKMKESSSIAVYMLMREHTVGKLDLRGKSLTEYE